MFWGKKKEARRACLGQRCADAARAARRRRGAAHGRCALHGAGRAERSLGARAERWWKKSKVLFVCKTVPSGAVRDSPNGALLQIRNIRAATRRAHRQPRRRLCFSHQAFRRRAKAVIGAVLEAAQHLERALQHAAHQ